MEHKAKKKVAKKKVPKKKVPFGVRVPKQVPSPTGKPSKPRSKKPEADLREKPKPMKKPRKKGSMFHIDEPLRKIGE